MAVSRFFKELVLGVRMSIQGTKFIFQHRLWWAFFFSALVAGVSIYFGVLISEDILQYEIPNDVRDSLPKLTYAVAVWFFKLLLLVMTFKLNKYIVLILLPPLLSKISERTEKIITGNTYKFSWAQLLADIKRSVRIAFNNFLWEAGLLLIWLILSLIFKQLEVLQPYYSFLIGLYFYGFSMLDYTIERRRLGIEESKRFIRKHAGLAFGIGLVYSALFLIHIDFAWFYDSGIMKNIDINIGVVFAPIICVVGATFGLHELLDLSKNTYAEKGEPKV